MRRKFLAAALGAAIFLGGLGEPFAASAQEASSGLAKRKVSLVGFGVDTQEPVVYQESVSPLCGYTTDTYTLGPFLGDADTRIKVAFREIAEARGYEVVGNAGSLFEEELEQTDYQVGVTLKLLKGRFCSNMLTLYETGRLNLEMALEWEIYSALDRKVVAKVSTSATTSGNAELSKFSDDIVAVFQANAEQFVDSPEFTAAFTYDPGEGGTGAMIASDDPLVMTSATGGSVREISDAVGSVVTIKTGLAHGSGFVISSEGHILTNAHVVSGQSEVIVRWSDGLETRGQVLRKHDQRDIAIIVTRPRREPLVLNTLRPQIGANVSAIGAPLEEELSGTVTRGIVSANRIFDGFAFIQSDVNVNPGNSGGPLLDESGAVIGITVSGVPGDTGALAGLNMFIPIQDAIDFLNLDVRQPQTAAVSD